MILYLTYFGMFPKLQMKQKEVRICSTVRKLQNFSVTQILREIKVGAYRVSKCAVLTQLQALNFDVCEFLHFLKAEI